MIDEPAANDENYHRSSNPWSDHRENKNKDEAEEVNASTLTIERASTIYQKMEFCDEDKVNKSNFELLRVLGQGASGRVFLVRKLDGQDANKLYAMKVIRKLPTILNAKLAEQTKNEREVLEAIGRCPFLVAMHYAFQTESKLYLVLDYVSGGDLFTFTNRLGRCFTEDEARILIAEIVLAIEQLHKYGIIHRDIKLENILLDTDGHIMVSDFGLSKKLAKNSNGRSYSNYCGTINYMAPEMMCIDGYGHDASVDWWSMGILCYQLMTGMFPFTSKSGEDNPYNVVVRVLHSTLNMRKIKGNVGGLIKMLLNKDPTKRLGTGPTGVEKMKNHPFFHGIDWKKLANKEIEMPLKPSITHALDTSNFGEEYTNILPEDTPCIPISNHKRFFRGFSFVAPDPIESQMPSTSSSGESSSGICRGRKILSNLQLPLTK